MKLHLHILIATLFVACAPDKKATSTPVKSTAKPSASVATTSKSTAKPTQQKKPAPPVVTEEETTSTQKVLETVPLAAPDSDFKKP